jgi:hypothetical protein
VQLEGEAGTAKLSPQGPIKLGPELLCVRVAGRPFGGGKVYRPERLIQYHERESRLHPITIRNHAFHRHFGPSVGEDEPLSSVHRCSKDHHAANSADLIRMGIFRKAYSFRVISGDPHLNLYRHSLRSSAIRRYPCCRDKC